MADLTGRVALITGAGRGQGRSHALRRARSGARIVVADIDFQQWGRIVNTSSTLGRQGLPNMANYVSSRWAQLGLVKVAAFELGPHNITVNAVCPTMVETEQVTNDTLYRLFRPDLDNPSREDAEVVMRQGHKLPTAWVQPNDVSAAVEFLVSDDARFITAIGLDVSAGKATEYGA